MNYQETISYMEENVKGLGSKPGLDSIRELLNRAGNPQKGLPAIHVAGSNGKGSTSAFIERALRENHYRVGWFSSPYLKDWREMIRINGTPISKNKAAEGLSLLIEFCQSMVEEGLSHPTEFEIQTALAFWYFKERSCDYIIMECGMGGALDATNVMDCPLLCVFTPISLEHCAYLGNTVAEIAERKVGILKKGCRAVSGLQSKEAENVLLKEAARLGVPLEILDKKDIRCRQKKEKGMALPKNQAFTYGEFKNMKISMLGSYQIENACLALLALLKLKEIGIKLKQDLIIKAFIDTKWQGRFEVLGKTPLVILDGAHNPDGVRKLMESVDFYFTNKRIIYIMSILKDKDADLMLKESVSRAEAVITVTSPNRERALPAFELAKQVREYNGNVTAADSVEEALEMAFLMAGREGIVLCFGTLSYLGVLREAYEKRMKDGR